MSNVEVLRVSALLWCFGWWSMPVAVRAQMLPRPVPAKLLGKTVFLSNAGGG